MRDCRIMDRTKRDEILCDKDGEIMQQIVANEISGDVGSPIAAYSCPKCGQVKMIPREATEE
jgi:hypothetical protein